MDPTLNWHTANPAPVVATLRASHMIAAFVLFDRDRAFGTLMGAKVLSPALINLIHRLLAVEPFMPRYLAFEADIS